LFQSAIITETANVDQLASLNGDAPPGVLGRYELIGKLGTGGMATVFLARTAGEAGFQRLFAIKVLHPHLAVEGDFIRMLLDEARIAARLHHPNVVPIVDLGSHQKVYYVAMEYIEGCSLSALLKKHRDSRPARLLVPIVLDMLAGLEAAHSLTDDAGTPMNLVHRDVSPQNVLIGIDGSARITDFGIARAESRLNITRPGQVKGKIAYMSPEQVRSAELDRRSDVFSAGAMLWSMLTGRKLFQADNDAATMSNIVHMDIPLPSTVGLQPPAVFDAICLCALQRDPSRRFASAQEMEDALRETATKANLLGSRRELAAWVTETFHEELAKRREVIREVAGALISPSGEHEGISPAMFGATAELPSFTPSSLSEAVKRSGEFRVANARSTTTKEPATKLLELEPPQITTIPPAPAQGRRRAIAVFSMVAVLCIVGGVLWFQLRSTDRASPAPPAAAITTPAAAKEPSAPAPDQVARRYVDEAEQLFAARRVDAAKELLDRARQANASDPDLVIRITKLGEQIVDDNLRNQARRSTDRAAAIEAAQQLLERNPDDAEAAKLLAAARGATPPPETKAKARGQLTVQTRAGAAVYVDDALVARGSFSQRAMSAGDHVVVVRQVGYAPARKAIRVTANRETKISITLEKAPAVAAAVPRAPVTPPTTSAPAPPASAPPDAAPPAPPTPPTPPPAVATTPPITQPPPPPPPPRPTPAVTPAAPTEIAAPRLPAAYSANNMKELGKVLTVIEGEAISRGGAPSSLRGVTNALAEDAFAGFSPGTAIEIHPSAIYYVIVRGVRAGKSASTISAELRAGHARGNL